MPAIAPWGRVIEPRTVDGLVLHGRLAEVAGARGHVVLLNGRTEFTEKYAGVVQSLTERGFSTVSLDWRGQGASPRLTADPMLGHIEDFDDYGRDLAALLALPAVGMLPRPRIVIAHSMGGAIALRWLAAQPAAAHRLVLSAPMLGLKLPRGLGWTVPLMARAAVALGLSRRYAPGGNADPYVLGGFADNVLTSDPAAFAALLAFVSGNDHAGLGGPSFAWLHAATAAMASLPKSPPVPTLAVLGSDEQVVAPRAIRNFASQPNGHLAVIEGARHEPFIETVARRKEVWAAIDAFLDA